MPNHIKTNHINRIFPFEFYDELNENLKKFTLLNPAFILRDKIKMTNDERKKLFEQARNNKPVKTLNQNNIMEIEPFGELVTLDVCCPTDKTHTVLHDKEKRGQIPLSIIAVQLYDSSGQPVFATDVKEATIKQIPEVLWDDPNLLLAIVSFNQEDSQVGVIKIPKQIENKLLEPVESSNTDHQSEKR